MDHFGQSLTAIFRPSRRARRNATDHPLGSTAMVVHRSHYALDYIQRHLQIVCGGCKGAMDHCMSNFKSGFHRTALNDRDVPFILESGHVLVETSLIADFRDHYLLKQSTNSHGGKTILSTMHRLINFMEKPSKSRVTVVIAKTDYQV